MKMITCPASAERWDLYEVTLHGPSDGNPFVDYWVKGIFSCQCDNTEVEGFYDGDGVYKVRFMPSFCGEYCFTVTSNFGEPQLGSFTVTPASAGNHGPVRIRGHHFEYEDGTPFFPVGTTSYVWTWQPLIVQEKTLKTLSEGYFNKMRIPPVLMG